MVALVYVLAVVLACTVIYSVTTFVRRTGEHLGLSLIHRDAIIVDLASLIPFIIFFIVANVSSNQSKTEQINTWTGLVITSIITGLIAGVARFPVRKS